VTKNVVAVAAVHLAGCEVRHHYDPDLLARVVQLQGEVGRLQGEVSSLTATNFLLIFFIVLAIIAAVAAVAFAIYATVAQQRPARPLRQIETVREVEPRYVVVIDRQTGQSREIPINQLPAPLQTRLLPPKQEGSV
jgi:hypothetical protein